MTRHEQIRPHVRWLRVLVLVLLLAGLASAVALLPFAGDGMRAALVRIRDDSAHLTLPSDDDFRAIILAIAAAARYEGGLLPAPESVGGAAPVGRMPVLLSDASLIVCPGKRQTFGGPDSVQVVTNDCPSILDDEILAESGTAAQIPQHMRVQLAQANRVPVAVPVLDQWLVRTVSDASIHAAIGDGGRTWPGFYTQFPGTAGYILVSRPVLTPDRAWAAIAVEYYCGGLCGYGSVYLLMRDDMGWKVVASETLWVS